MSLHPHRRSRAPTRPRRAEIHGVAIAVKEQNLIEINLTNRRFQHLYTGFGGKRVRNRLARSWDCVLRSLLIHGLIGKIVRSHPSISGVAFGNLNLHLHALVL
jgi:hypothetical protein